MNISKMCGHLDALGIDADGKNQWYRMHYYVESVFLEDKKRCEEVGYKVKTSIDKDTHGRIVYNLQLSR